MGVPSGRPLPTLTGMPDGPDCDLVLPCRDEGPALEALLPRVPRSCQVMVVDNGSTDEPRLSLAASARSRHREQGQVMAPRCTRASWRPPRGTSRSWTATVPSTPKSWRRCWGTLVRAAPTLQSAAACLSGPGCGPGTPASATPWSGPLRRRIGMDAHDIAPMRVSRRDALLALGIKARAVRLPRRLMRRAVRGLALRRARRLLPPSRGRTRSKVSGSIIGTIRTARDFARVLR